MCGICGIASATAGAPDPRTVAAMSSALIHRGPDSEGLFNDGQVALAARRLSIIDVEGGSQPIANEQQTVRIVHNGEIYNYAELRAGLLRRGHRLATSCDTEVLVHLYEDMGPDFVSALRGMFALALWDSEAQRLILARDPFGIKPLYYAERSGRLSFASELRALMRDRALSCQVDLPALEGFLAFNSVPGPSSIFAGARKLPPGHILSWTRDGVRSWEYERPRPVPEAETRQESGAVLADELLGCLRDSIEAHMVADVPVGVLLSGGVDSSAITALAADAAGPGLKTFSIGFEEQSFDELKKARLVARRYGTDHHELVLRPDGAELLTELAEAFDEPFGDSSALPTYLVSRLAADHVKVALSGEGGDELFGGYYTYVADLMAPRVGWLAAAARPLIERIPSSAGKASFDYKAKRFARGARLPALERHHAWKEIFSADARGELLRPEFHSSSDPLDAFRSRYAETLTSEPLARLQDVDLRVYLVDDLLVKADRASMAHSLETRVPFLDPAVAGLALALPTKLKVRGLSKKRLLRRAVKPLLPASITNGRKQGFSIPAAAWLRGPLEPFTREVLAEERVRQQGYFQPKAITQLIDLHTSERQDLSRQLWGLLGFSLWLDTLNG